MIELNEYQTQVDDLFFEHIPDQDHKGQFISAPQEVRDQFFEFLNSVPYIKWLVSKDRPRAKDLKRDEQGRIIVDLAHPHILENMDYFRESAIHFEKHGCYTFLKPNANPNSEFGKWIRRERDRCWYGMVRPEDGEWVTGLMYFYLNYCPIMKTRVRAGSNMAERVQGFPNVWEGTYLRFHYIDQARKLGKHAIELARRGAGKSFSLAAIMAHNFILGESADACKRQTTMLTAHLKEYLAGKDGTISKFVPIIDHVAQTMEWPRQRLRNSMQDFMWQAGYVDLDTGVQKGSLNMVLGISLKDDAEKLRGKRGWFLFEEMGSYPSLTTVYNIVRYGVEEGDYTFGLCYLVGTAAEEASDFAAAKSLLYAPDANNLLPIENVYDKVNQGKPKFGFFYPAYVNRLGCMNKDGVSDVTKAILQILMQRYKAKYESNDPSLILKRIAEMPITPAEAIMKVARNMFPVGDLTNRLGQIDGDPGFYDRTYVADLQLSDGKVIYTPSGKQPIREFPHENNKIEGAVEIYEMPQTGSDGKVFSNRYIAGIDPYNNDQSTTMSLGSIFVLDLWTDRIVCEYTGRPQYNDEFCETCRRIALFYDARVNYENNIKSIFAYFSRMNCLYLLTDTLDFLRDKNLVKGPTFGNTSKGTVATAPINSYARSLIREWLIKPVQVKSEEDDGSGGTKEIVTTTPNLYFLRGRALIQELINWNEEGNFDRVSSLGMLMLLREDRLAMYQGDMGRAKSNDRTGLAYDPFFDRYDKDIASHYNKISI